MRRVLRLRLKHRRGLGRGQALDPEEGVVADGGHPRRGGPGRVGQVQGGEVAGARDDLVALAGRQGRESVLRRRLIEPPSIGSWVGMLVLWWLSLSPTLLPRSPLWMVLLVSRIGRYRVSLLML